MLLWSLMLFTLGQLAGQVAMMPRIDALQARLEEREETADNVWALYESAHCALKRAELSISQHLWPGATYWPDGDASGIPCPTDAAGSPLLASAEDAAPSDLPEALEEESAEAARGRGRQALVSARAGPGPDVSGEDGEGLHP